MKPVPVRILTAEELSALANIDKPMTFTATCSAETAKRIEADLQGFEDRLLAEILKRTYEQEDKLWMGLK